ncbi:hypothetical protein [Ferrimicrobium sp.]|uniref:hypothetical protein n=1 Tax=Ferrimicrobium sp. TaxID=2926050 RepID=UPI002639AA0B|nr:hypothetical protein [Ferrimicrobium sp.]
MAKKKETWGTEMNYVREVIRLHYELEKNRNEIAQSLGISHAIVRGYLDPRRGLESQPGLPQIAKTGPLLRVC